MTKKQETPADNTSEKIIKDFEFISHDFVGEDKFDSSEVTTEDYQKVVTGKGMSERDAAENAIEELRKEENNIDISLLLEKIVNLDEVYYDPPMELAYIDEDGESDNDGYREESAGEMSYFFSIRYNLPT